MIPPEQAALFEILLDGVNVTNSERQAMRWAHEIIERLDSAGYAIVHKSDTAGAA